jgi:hypothetical protein
LIEHCTTVDAPEGMPWPPPEDGWVLVGPASSGQSLWRRFSVSVAGTQIKIPDK